MAQYEDGYDPQGMEARQQDPLPDGAPVLSIQVIANPVPLDDQFGVFPPRTVPETLREPLFGQPEPTMAEIAAAGGDPDKVPPMQTYAILDAARVANLAVTLDTTELEHRCLFKGAARNTLKDVAPWIVRLEEGNRFTRHLFTKGPAGWHLWDRDPGLYIRSRAGLDDLWRHFRKFTRVQDEHGQWFYFRFWEPRVARTYFDAIRSDEQRFARWFLVNRAPRHQVAAFIGITAMAGPPAAFVVRAPLTLDDAAAPAFELGQRERTAFSRARREAYLAALPVLLARTFPDRMAEFSAADADRFIRRSVSRMDDFGIRQRDNIFRLVALDLHTGGTFERSDADGILRQILEAEIPEDDKMRRLSERMGALDAVPG